MSEQDRVTVNDASGPVNNGTGPQNVYTYYNTASDRPSRKGTESVRITREDRVWLADRFVPPMGYRIAAERLETPGSVVLLHGQPGSGRRAAAIMLLHEIGGNEGAAGEEIRFEEFPVMGKNDSPLAPGAGDRFLVDLSGFADEETYHRAQHRLAASRAQVQGAKAHMVVVLPAGMEHAHLPELGPHTVRLGRPRGIAMVTRYLRMDRMPFRYADLERAGIRQLCDRSPMQELAKLSSLVRDARDSGRFGSGFPGWLDQAMHAVTDRAGEVSRQVAAARSAPARTLLLAAAMFEGTPSDTVYAAWRCLMRMVRHEEEATTELARSDFGERLDGLGIERAPDGRLRFAQLAYADAVRTYFWANFPGVRSDLRNWIGDAAGLEGLTADDRVGVVVRFGEQALATGRPDDLFDLVTRWTDQPGGPQRAKCAVAALELGLIHERFGGWFRRRMYECVRSGSLPDGLTRVLTTVCVQSLGVTHPAQAVVRLHHLAVRKGEAASEAREALFDLAGRDRRLYRLLIDRLRARLVQEAPDAEPHLRLLTELLRSDRAPESRSWPDLFVGWVGVFSRQPTELWGPLVNSWLNTVAHDGTQWTALDLMVRATGGGKAALHRLYTLACAWVGAEHHSNRSAVDTLFWEHIDHAQYGRADAGQRTTEETR